MNFKHIVIVFIFLSIPVFFISFKPKTDTNWEKATDKNGIIVYLRVVPDSPIKEFKAQTHIKAPINKIIAFLKDFRSYPTWIYANEGTYLIQKKEDKEFIYYTRIKLPKPVDDRDLVVQMKIVEQTENKCIIKSTGLPKFIAEKPNTVRVKQFQGSWELTSINSNETLVVMQSHTEPAGAIPTWLINSMITNGPFETLENMNKILTGKK